LLSLLTSDFLKNEDILLYRNDYVSKQLQVDTVFMTVLTADDHRSQLH